MMLIPASYCLFLVFFVIGSTSSMPGKYLYYLTTRIGHQMAPLEDHHDHHHDCHDHHHHEVDDNPEQGPTQFGFYDRNGCSCQFYADGQLVYRTNNVSVWHSCTGMGLHRCGQLCESTFQDETLSFRSRQNACDTLGKDVYVGWHRRHQVCGPQGPYQDIYLQRDLCCRRGRPSDACAEE